MVDYLSGSETTERESLLDTLTIRHVAETPLIRSLPHMKIVNRVTEFPIDKPFTASDVRTPSTPHANTRAESASFTDDTPEYPTKLRAIAEINHFARTISNTDRETILAGVTDTFDYRAHNMFMKLLNNIETVLMYGVGSPETDGSGTDERMTQGLIHWSAWTGLERLSGSTVNAISDPYNIAIASAYWSVFHNAGGVTLTRQMLYEKILANFARAGGNYSVPLLFHVGFKLKNICADLGQRADGSNVNDRNVPADALMTYDSIDWIRTPIGTVGFRTNRYLDMEGSTFTVNNQDFTPGAPTSPGTVGSTTFQADATMIGWEPGQVAIGWLRPPQYTGVATTADNTRIAAVAEYALIVRHPLCVLGGGNLLS